MLPGREVCKADVYLRHSSKLETASIPTSITGDSKGLLIGFEDGSLATCTWTGKVPGFFGPVCPSLAHMHRQR